MLKLRLMQPHTCTKYKQSSHILDATLPTKVKKPSYFAHATCPDCDHVTVRLSGRGRVHLCATLACKHKIETTKLCVCCIESEKTYTTCVQL